MIRFEEVWYMIYIIIKLATLMTHVFMSVKAKIVSGRDYFVHAPCQWETTLHCNVIAHWLGAYTNCSPFWWWLWMLCFYIWSVRGDLGVIHIGIYYVRHFGPDRLIVVYWNGNVVILMEFSSLPAQKIVILTTFSAAIDEDFVKMTIIWF